MTNIRLAKGGSTVRMECEGHSGYSSIGTDIVCAGISACAYSWVELCERLKSERKVIIRKCEERDGYVFIEIADPYGYTEYAFELVRICMEGIAESYPEFVCVEWEELNF